MNSMKLSIVIPAYNEEKRIEKTLNSYVNCFGPKFGDQVEIIVVSDGCRDGMLEIVKKFSEKHKIIRLLAPPKRLGKGGGVRRGFEVAKGDIVGFVDADDAFEIKGIEKLVEFVNSGYDCAIASKWAGRSFLQVTEPFFRKIAGRVWNLIIRVLFGLKVADVQAGAKFFKYSVLEGLPPLRCTGFEFDVELLWRIRQKGYTVKEIYIPTTHMEGSTFKISHTKNMLISILKLRLNLL